jgi:PD-(D/E)XK nuclease superfamily
MGITVDEEESVVSNKNRVFRLTPGLLDIAQDCGYRFAVDVHAKQHGRRHIEQASYNLALGKAVHELMNHANHALMGGADSFSTNGIMERFWNPSYFAESEQAAEAAHTARTMLSNYQIFLGETGLTLLASEQFIKTRVMTVAGRIPLVLSGKIDAVLQGEDDTIFCMDWKTGNSLPAPDTLMTRLSSTAYRCVASVVYSDVPAIEVGQMLLGTGVSIIVDLPAATYESGKQQIRDLVIALDTDPGMTGPFFGPRSGEYCAWCPHQEICPLFSSEEDAMEAPF